MDFRNLPSYQVEIMQAAAFRTWRSMLSQILKKHDITAMQWAVLGLVHESKTDGMSIGALAKELATSLAFVTSTVNQLVEKKLLVRENDPKDNRGRIITLAPKHTDLVDKLETEIKEEVKRIFTGKISRIELGMYAKVLTKLANFDAKISK